MTQLFDHAALPTDVETTVGMRTAAGGGDH